MILQELKPRKALNKAFLKVKPNRTEIEDFKSSLISLLDQINDQESEEFHENLVSDFLKVTYYKQNHFINTKGRNDLVIHNGSNANSTVGVIIEAKKPTNRTEMMTTKKLNTKAFQELVLYYLRERLTHKNLEVKHLVATNINQWFIFDATLFDRLFAQNKNLVKQFQDFEGGRLADTNTDFFYKQIAEPFIESISAEIPFTCFDLQDYRKPLRNSNKTDDNSLIALFKILSPEHLLKLPFTNDNNSLDKRFYSELLHIIGLSENKKGSKKLIERNEPDRRNSGTILEDAIIQLDSLDKLSRFEKPDQFGKTHQERLFNVALELCITWINRILFLKLLEAQIIAYHKGDKSYSFLNIGKIKSYDDLNSLFFQVLARNYYERNEDVKKAFDKVPYLNSSLFEPTDIEQVTLFISNLKDDKTIPVFSQTVLKDEQGKRRTGNIYTLEYLFEFLNAYDFSSEGSEEIQEDNKTLINASVLGLIFEKINGYKDGSYFTPGFITMYMARETIRKAVIQKFIEHCRNQNFHEIKINTIEDIYELIPEKISRKKANEIVNSLKICDPAVGSGHFLVSALNEIIAIKNDLKILEDKNGKSLHRCTIEVVNDELIVTDEDGELFEYIPASKESQRIQETLFHEKQTIIENCLFGVDINPNSVKICRLRLWIELLKNAYYKNATELETLPNIDINIKCGNSLVSRFAIDVDLKQIAKSAKWSIFSYQNSVEAYKKSSEKPVKRELEALIRNIKSNYINTIQKRNPKLQKYHKLRQEYEYLFPENGLFAHEPELTSWGDAEKLESEKQRLITEIEKIQAEIESEKSFFDRHNAFEWRFEFPEVLNEDGDFVGFDVIIGNPPYIPLEAFEIGERRFFNNKFSQLERKYETSVPFILEGLRILNNNGLLSYIAPVTWQTGENYSKFRNYFFKHYGLEKLINLPFNIFEDAYVDTALYFIGKEAKTEYSFYAFDKKAKIESFEDLEYSVFRVSELKPPDFKVIIDKTANQFSGYDSDSFVQLGSITKSTQGLSASNFPKTATEISEYLFPFLAKGNVYNYCLIKDSVYNTDLTEKQNLIQFYQAEPKILIRRIISRQDRLSVTYCNEKLVFKKDINPFIPIDKKFDCFFILGIMASKLISFIYLNSSSIATKDDFRQTTLKELRKLPIPNIDIEIQKPIINLVKEILRIKSENSNADTTNLETQTDQLVYQLYDLTEEEIKIIENAYKHTNNS